jgi:hypothetical protein
VAPPRRVQQGLSDFPQDLPTHVFPATDGVVYQAYLSVRAVIDLVGLRSGRLLPFAERRMVGLAEPPTAHINLPWVTGPDFFWSDSCIYKNQRQKNE